MQKKYLQLTTTLLMLTIFSSSCRRIPFGLERLRAIPFVGLDENGKSEVTYMPKRTYQKHVSRQLNSILMEVPKTLAQAQATPHMRVYQVTVGLGINVELGIPRVFAASIEPSFRLWFRDMDAHNN